MKDCFFDRYEANGFDNCLYEAGKGLRIERRSVSTGRKRSVELSQLGLEQLTFILLKYFDVESNNPWQFSPQHPFPWYLHPNLQNFEKILSPGAESKAYYEPLDRNWSFEHPLKREYFIDGKKRVEIDSQNNIYIISPDEKIVFHYSEISRLLRGIQQMPYALQGGLLPIFRKWQEERKSLDKLFDPKKVRGIERGKADFTPPGICICELNYDLGLSRSCFNKIVGSTCSKENICMYCYDARNKDPVPSMHEYVIDYSLAEMPVIFDDIRERELMIPLRSGKNCEPGHIISRARFIDFVEETREKNLYRIITTKNLGIDMLVASNIESYNSVLQFSLSDIPFSKLERGANYWCCDNEERIRAAKWYSEQGNVCFRLVWDITGEKSDFVRHVEKTAEETGIKVLHTPARFGSGWMVEETVGMSWDEVQRKKYISSVNANNHPGNLVPRTSAINPELRKQLGDNTGELVRMCGKTRDMVDDDHKQGNLFGQRDQTLYWCGKCFSGISGGIYDKHFLEKPKIIELREKGLTREGRKGKKR